MNIADLYARVVAKRPDLAVTCRAIRPEVSIFEDGTKAPSTWRLIHGWNDDGEWRFQTNELGRTWHSLHYPEAHAAALILARWEDCLPVGTNVKTLERGCMVWHVDSPTEYRGASRLEALAAFYLEETK